MAQAGEAGGVSSSECLTDLDILELVDEGMTLGGSASQTHLDGCANCRRLVAEMLRAQGGQFERSQFVETVSDESSASSNEEAQAEPFSSGYVLADRWRIIDRIGKGGFGLVYSAYDIELEVNVAIKVLRPERESHRGAIRRFKQEIQLARKVTHENVCRIFDVGFFDQEELRVPFLSMELLEGMPLDQLVRERGPTKGEELKRITLQVVSGLEAAHKVGIVHADLKPANIMLVDTGDEARVVVTDFGLASAYAAGAQDKSTQLIGTPAYMAPEQVEGKRLGPAADYYALGCTLYQLIGGRLPFVGDSALSTARARLSAAPPRLDALAPTTPSVWVDLIYDLMAKDPEERLASASEIRRRLENKPIRVMPILALALMGLLITAASIAYFVVGGDRGEEARDPFALSLPRDAETRARFLEGQKLYDEFRQQDALAVWEKAIDDGFVHARIHKGRCSTRFRTAPEQHLECTRLAYEAAKSLPWDEQAYYQARYLTVSGEYTESTSLLLELLNKYPENALLLGALKDVQIQLKEYDAALATLEKVNASTPAESLELAVSRANVLTEAGRFQESLDLAKVLLPRAVEQGNRWIELKLENLLSGALANLGQLEEAGTHGVRAAQLAREAQSINDEAKALAKLVSIDVKEHRLERALHSAERRAALLGEQGDTLAQKQGRLTRAEILAVVGQPMQAEKELSDNVLPMFRSGGHNFWVGYTLVARALVRRSIGKYETALDDCSTAELVFDSLGKERLLSYAQLVHAQILLSTGELSKAQEFLHASRKLRTALKLDLLLLQNSLVEAEAELLDGDAEKAYEHASLVASEYNAKGITMHELVARELMGRAALAMSKIELAREALMPALAVGAREHREIALELRLTELRVKRMEGAAGAVKKEIQSLAREARNLGYVRVAELAQQALVAR